LHVRNIPVSIDGEKIGKREALVIDEKSIPAAEGYIFSLLYLYINVYFHKTTRGLEKIFSALIERIAVLLLDGGLSKTGLPESHPLVRFLKDPDAVGPFLELDDTVVLGSLSMLANAEDAAVAELATRIRDRKVYSCIDVTRRMEARLGLPKPGAADVADFEQRRKAVERGVAAVTEAAKERGLLEPGDSGLPRVLQDLAPRSPYKRFDDASKPFTPIYVIGADSELHDLADMSAAVNSLPTYKAYRLYAREESDRNAILAMIEEVAK
jgi:HD superfamily phosphohydrolase